MHYFVQYLNIASVHGWIRLLWDIMVVPNIYPTLLLRSVQCIVCLCLTCYIPGPGFAVDEFD